MDLCVSNDNYNGDIVKMKMSYQAGVCQLCGKIVDEHQYYCSKCANDRYKEIRNERQKEREARKAMR